MSSFDKGTSGSRAERAESAAPACPTCKSPSTVAASKARGADIYWRCNMCGEVWNVGRHHGRSEAASPRPSATSGWTDPYWSGRR